MTCEEFEENNACYTKSTCKTKNKQTW